MPKNRVFTWVVNNDKLVYTKTDFVSDRKLSCFYFALFVTLLHNNNKKKYVAEVFKKRNRFSLGF